MLAAKRKTPRNEKFMAWVREQDSCVSRVYRDVIVHHVRCFGWGGMGIKPSDYRVVPLTHAEHMMLHQHGEVTFWEDVEIDPRVVIAANMIVYMRDILREPLSASETAAMNGRGYNEMVDYLENRIVSLTTEH